MVITATPKLSSRLTDLPQYLFSVIATPAHLVFPQIDAEALEAALLPPVAQSSAVANAAAEAARKESLSGSSSLSGKKSVKEIVASIDPRVRVEPEVEDVSPSFSLRLSGFDCN